MKNDQIELRCELCSNVTGITLTLGDLLEKIPGLKPEGEVYLHGICPRCQTDLDEGCVIFVDANRRVMKVSLEATKEKILPEFWGKVVKIPVTAMTELIKAWAQANGATQETS